MTTVQSSSMDGQDLARAPSDVATVAAPVPLDGPGASSSAGNVESSCRWITSSTAPSSVPMGEYEYQGLGEESPRVSNHRKVSIIQGVFLIFYEVSGGPFGIEDSVNAAGPLLAILGFLVFPFIWSIPEALITAELSTMFPENGGYVVWVSSALGPFLGFQLGWMKWLSGVIDNALYPVLFLDYLKSSFHVLGGGWPRTLAVLILTAVLTYMNYRGLTIVGWAAVLLGVFSILSFIVMGFVAIPKLKPSRWLVVDIKSVSWNLYLNTLFWNLNYWDSISTLAGEVHNLKRTLPKALFYTLFLEVPIRNSTCGDLVLCLRCVLLSWMSFQEIIAAENFLYCFGMLLEFAAFITLRMKHPRAQRPYKVPLGTAGVVLMLIPPTVLVFVVLAFASHKVMLVSMVAVLIGFALQPGLKYAERKRYLRFIVNPDLPVFAAAVDNSNDGNTVGNLDGMNG
ncbi:hypothetical protein J5N97_000190 [Dioscorea zingiberensis]|uniref:Uncharacterized protein n=1 Tax=Dioscorea zingiberensis TaxID=325984 RepID=A0A9D5H347_9LILI|nr:hypothetical protein J5N97_000190 [Dioscorea zingiberensis]